MSDTLARLRRGNFVVVGRAGVDLFTHPGERAEKAESVLIGLGGSAANTAAGICKLGGRAALVTRVSSDVAGDYALAQLKRYGVDAAHVGRVGGEFRNSLAFYESRLEGHRTVIYRNGAADLQMDEADVEAVDWSRFGAMVTAGTVFAAEPSRAAAFRAMELARAAGLPVVFDVDYRPYSWPSPAVAEEVLSRAAAASDMIVGNDEEWGFMAGGAERGLAKARALAEAGHVTIYKMGPDGARTFEGGEEIATGIYPVQALKPTGAGDSFLAGLLVALSEGRDLREAILRGSACAAITVSRPGCAPAMADTTTLETFLAEHPGPTGA